jgi:hypothetical protein
METKELKVHPTYGEQSNRGYGANPSRSWNKAKFLVGCGKNKERAEKIAELMNEKFPQKCWSDAHFAADVDPGKGEQAVFCVYPFSLGMWQSYYAWGQNFKKQTSTRKRQR